MGRRNLFEVQVLKAVTQGFPLCGTTLGLVAQSFQDLEVRVGAGLFLRLGLQRKSARGLAHSKTLRVLCRP